MKTGTKIKPEVTIPDRSFPNESLPDSEKETREYGLSVGQAISNEWFSKTTGNSCRYYTMWGEYHRRRLYARARQPIDKYKSQIAVNGDMSYLNYDFTPVPIIPKFVDMIVNGMDDREM